MTLEHTPRTGWLLDVCDRYLDAAPRLGAAAEDAGGFTVFVSRGPWPYYARPRPDARSLTGDDLDLAAAVMRREGMPCELEWVVARQPGLAAVAREHGWTVREHPLLVLRRTGALVPTPLRGDIAVALVDADSPLVPQVRAVSAIAFEHLGTDVGEPGAPHVGERLAAADDDVRRGDAHVRGRLAAGLMRCVAAVDPLGSVLAAGFHQPAPVEVPGRADALVASEIVGVGTLPAARRQGLAAAVTAALAHDAIEHGAEVVLLTAGSDDVARIYERLGFDRIGATGAASLA